MFLNSIELVCHLGCEGGKGSIDCLTFVVWLRWEISSGNHLAGVASGHCPLDAVIDYVAVIRDSGGNPGCGTACRDRGAVIVRHVADVVVPEFDDKRTVLTLGLGLRVPSLFAHDCNDLDRSAISKFSRGEFLCQHFRVVSSSSQWLSAAVPCQGLHDA